MQQQGKRMARGKAHNADAKAGNGTRANLGFEAQMFLAASKLRTHLEPSDDEHIVLDLIFLTSFSPTREARQPILNMPTHLRPARLFHLRTSVSERSMPGFAA